MRARVNRGRGGWDFGAAGGYTGGMNAEERIQRIVDATPPELLADASPALDGWVTTVVLREVAVYELTVKPKADEPLTVEARP